MLVGIKCPYREIEVPKDDCYNCAMTNDNPCPYTAPIIKSILENENSRDYISVTTLLSCPRKYILSQKSDYYDTLDNMFYKWRGTVYHGVVDSCQDSSVAMSEERFEVVIDGIKLTGKPDELIVDKGILRDYKTTKKLPKYDVPYVNHTAQLNIYKYILEQNLRKDNPNFKIIRMEIIYLDMEGIKKTRAPIWTEEKVVNFIIPRLQLLDSSIKNNIIPEKVDVKDMWQCGYCSINEQCERLHRKEIEQRYISEFKDSMTKVEPSNIELPKLEAQGELILKNKKSKRRTQ